MLRGRLSQEVNAEKELVMFGGGEVRGWTEYRGKTRTKRKGRRYALPRRF